jgi:hypothetical protein
MYNTNGVMESHFRIAVAIISTIVCLSAHIILSQEIIIKGNEAFTKKNETEIQGIGELRDMFEQY